MRSKHPVAKKIRHKSARFRLEIGRSRIHRFGVFALDDIPAGRDVIEYTGKRLSPKQAIRLKEPRDQYVLGSSFNHLIDARTKGSGAEFINHSCDPNLFWRQDGGRLFFYSRRPIRAREELTIYYGHPVKARRVPCLCGARRCRKTLRYIVR